MQHSGRTRQGRAFAATGCLYRDRAGSRRLERGPVFREWFELELIDLIWDLVDEPLSSDPPFPEDA